MTERTGSSEDKTVLDEARARFKEAFDADVDNRRDGLDDLKFAWNYNDCQWPSEVRKLRENRPCLVENRLPQYIRHIVNAQRQNRPSITVAPANEKATAEVANVIEGMVRHVEQWSKADLAYDSAFESAVSAGVGYFRITTEYVDDDGFDLDVCIRPIDNAFSVYDDPHYQLPDGSDRKYCFVTEWVDRDEFKAEHGFEPMPFDQGQTGEDARLWYEEKRVQVAEYWRLRIEKTDIEGEPGLDGKKPKRERCKKVVEQFLMTGDKIIKKSDWLGVYIPIIPVFGEVKNIEGRKYRKSLIRDAKDPARMNNYFVSAEVEAVALQPKAPFIGPAGSFETDDVKWSSANVDNHAYIQYDVVEGGTPPQRQPPPMFPAALREVRMGLIESMKAIMGIYDASLGARSNETSGVAIEARAEQSDNATYHYLDNMTRAIRYAGLVSLDLFPKIYSGARVARIVGANGEATMVAINQWFINPQTQQEQFLNVNSKDGRYDVVVKAGPSFATQREESRDWLVKLAKAYPPLMQLAGDQVFLTMDFPEAKEIAKRLAPKGEGLPPQVQQQIEQMQQMIQQGKQYIGELEHKGKQQELKLAGKDLDLKAKDMALRDKGEANANARIGTVVGAQNDAEDRISDSKKFVIETILEFMKMQNTNEQESVQRDNDNEQAGVERENSNANAAVDRAQAMEPKVERLVQ